MRPALVVFDCDGVLVDTEILQVEVEARVLSGLGWPIETDEVVRRWMGRTAAAQLAEIGERLGEEGVRRYRELTTAEVQAAFDRELVEVEGISGLLDVLERAGVPTCVASS